MPTRENHENNNNNNNNNNGISDDDHYYSQQDYRLQFYESEYEDEDDDIEEIEAILDYEDLNDSDNMRMIDKKYYIGCYTYEKYENILLFVRKIHINTFFQFPNNMISQYFFWYSGIYLGKNPSIEILQLHKLPDRTYTAVIKTFWIKIIQRTWKKIYKQLQEYISYRRKWSTIRNLEIGQKTNGHIRCPSLRGMLANY
jgi:hypothetical protein